MTILWILGILVAALAIIIVLYLALLRPWSHRRGATAAEIGSSLPGDDLVLSPKDVYTQAITIDAPPAEVWPWLVQIGYGRAGWYTYDWFYKLTGSADFYDGDRSADRIIPELQDLQVGDTVELAQGIAFDVVTLEPSRALVLLARADLDTSEAFEPSDTLPDKYISISWAYVLHKLDGNRTRLLVRWHGDTSPGPSTALMIHVPTEAGALVMQPKLLKGIKARAEGTRGP